MYAGSSSPQPKTGNPGMQKGAERRIYNDENTDIRADGNGRRSSFRGGAGAGPTCSRLGRQRLRVDVDVLEEKAEVERVQERPRLGEIRALDERAAPERERESLKARRAHAEAAEDVVRHEKHGATVDSAREADADRFVRGNRLEPLCDFVRERADIEAADLAEVPGADVPPGRERPHIAPSGIRAADEAQRDDVVRGHHARIARVELIAVPVRREPSLDRI